MDGSGELAAKGLNVVDDFGYVSISQIAEIRPTPRRSMRSTSGSSRYASTNAMISGGSTPRSQ
jgi:hypothetical protein